jgi:hypothetical protein
MLRGIAFVLVSGFYKKGLYGGPAGKCRRVQNSKIRSKNKLIGVSKPASLDAQSVTRRKKVNQYCYVSRVPL